MKKNGFTLIELIMVLTLVVILAVFVVPMIFRGGAGVSVSAMSRKIKDDILYAQTLAMQRHKLSTPAANPANLVYRYRVRFNFNDATNCPGTNNYSIVNDSDFDGIWGEDATESAREPLSGEDFFCVQLNTGDYAGITASADFGGSTPGILEFDSFGTPYDSDGAKLTGVKTISISKSGETATVTITPYTGSVTVQ
jgi:prepilin-type N-terminal cleavage/methylation domain-containing protein